MGDVQTRNSGTIIAFPAVAHRPDRPALGPDEVRGQILFFTGVRYERQPEFSPEPYASKGQSRGRRRRS